MQRTRHLKRGRERTEAQIIEDLGSAKMQKRELAEAGMEPPVAHRRLRIDVVRLGKPVDGFLLAPDLVGELQRNRLPAGEDAAVGHAVQVVALELAAVPDD